MDFWGHRYPQEVCLEGEANNHPLGIIEFTLAMDGLALCAMRGCDVALIVMDNEFYQHEECPLGVALEEAFNP